MISIAKGDGDLCINPRKYEIVINYGYKKYRMRGILWGLQPKFDNERRRKLREREALRQTSQIRSQGPRPPK